MGYFIILIPHHKILIDYMERRRVILPVEKLGRPHVINVAISVNKHMDRIQ